MKNPNWIVALLALWANVKMFGQRFFNFEKPDTLPNLLPGSGTQIYHDLGMLRDILDCGVAASGRLEITDNLQTVEVKMYLKINACDYVAAKRDLELMRHTVQMLFPPDADFISTATVGQKLLLKVLSDEYIPGWRQLPTKLLRQLSSQ